MQKLIDILVIINYTLTSHIGINYTVARYITE